MVPSAEGEGEGEGAFWSHTSQNSLVVALGTAKRATRVENHLASLQYLTSLNTKSFYTALIRHVVCGHSVGN